MPNTIWLNIGIQLCHPGGLRRSSGAQYAGYLRHRSVEYALCCGSRQSSTGFVLVPPSCPTVTLVRSPLDARRMKRPPSRRRGR